MVKEKDQEPATTLSNRILGLFRLPPGVTQALLHHPLIRWPISFLPQAWQGSHSDLWVLCDGTPEHIRFEIQQPRNSMPLSNHNPFQQTWKCIARETDLRTGVAKTFDISVIYLQPVMLSKPDDYQKSFEQMQERLRKEVAVLETVKHRNVLPILAHSEGESLARQIIVAPFYESASLSDWILKERRDTKELLGILGGLANGIQHLHRQQVVHGSLKADAIFIDEEGQPVISGFEPHIVAGEGFNIDSDDLLPMPDWKDHHRWLSPERLQHPRISADDDVFALGCLILFVWTRQVPYFVAKNRPEFWELRLNNQPPCSLEQRNKLAIPDTWWNIMQICWLPSSSAEEASGLNKSGSGPARPHVDTIHQRILGILRP